MNYRLCEQVSFCWAGERAVFLDLGRDRYFCLAAGAEAIFHQLVAARGEGVPGVDQLTALRLVEDQPGPGVPLQPTAATAAKSSLIDAVTRPPRPGVQTTLEIAWRLQRARRALRRRPLYDIVRRRRLARETVAAAVDKAPASAALAAQFNAVRRRMPFAPACLPDALALLDFLAARGIYPDLVFAVRLNPFAAHCWVQAGETVLNDALDNARAHTPILVV
jgi:hypothetical protein